MRSPTVIALVSVLAVIAMASWTCVIEQSDSMSAIFPDFVVDGVQYDHAESEGEVEIAGLRNDFEDASFDIPETVTYLDVDYKVVGIKASALYGESGLTSVTIPSTVTAIGYNAFKNCSGLTEIEIPDSVTSIGYDAFYGCTGLKSLTLGSGVTELPAGCFYGCTGLTSVTIPDSIIAIDGSFEGCRNITELDLGSVERLMGNAFANLTRLTSVTIPDSVTEIGPAFRGCTSLVDVEMPDSVTSLEGTFEGCTSLTSIPIGTGVTELGDRTFAGCKFEEVTVPSTVRTLGDAFADCTSLVRAVIQEGTTRMNGGFSGCYNLSEVTIPSTVTYIGSAFPSCNALQSVRIPDSVSTLSGTFQACIGLKDVEIEGMISVQNGAFSACTALETFDMTKVTDIGSQAFYVCTGLKGLEFNENLSSIGSEAFAGCTSLEVVSIPHYNAYRQITIGSGAFMDCWNLRSVYIGENVTWVGDHAFSDCAALEELTFLSTGYVGDAVFDGCDEIQRACIYNSDLIGQMKLGWNLRVLELGGDITNVTERQFSLLGSLKTLILGEGIIAVDNYAFVNSNDLELIAIPDSLLAIGHSAFNITNRGCLVAGPEGCLDGYIEGDPDYGLLVTYRTSGHPEGDRVYYEWVSEGERVEYDVEDVPGYKVVTNPSYNVDASEDIIVTVRYTDQMYTIRFTDGDTVVSEMVIREGDPIVPPAYDPEPVTEGDFEVRFTGWEGYSQGMVATENKTFRAGYENYLAGLDYAVTEEGSIVIPAKGVDGPFHVSSDVALELMSRMQSEGLSEVRFVFEAGDMVFDVVDIDAMSDGLSLLDLTGQFDVLHVTLEGREVSAEISAVHPVDEGYTVEIRSNGTGSQTVLESTYSEGTVTFTVSGSGDYKIADVKLPEGIEPRTIIIVIAIVLLVMIALILMARSRDEC